MVDNDLAKCKNNSVDELAMTQIIEVNSAHLPMGF